MERRERVLVGARLRACRQARELSQEQVAEQIGISAKFYGMIERGEKGMSLDTLLKLRLLLGFNLDYLLAGDGTRAEHTASIQETLRTLRPDKLRYAEEIVRAFARSHDRP